MKNKSADRVDPMVGPGGIREISARWVITGEMVLDSATHLGSGEEGATVDMVLARDRAEGKPLLSGSSLAGALRSYLVDRLYGYAREEPIRKCVASLFGGTRGDDEGSQSSLIIFDSISEQSDQSPEIRDGVAIDPRTGLAEDHKKFDLEVIPRRTSFPLRFELVVASAEAERELVRLLAAALCGLEDGEIPIGARRSRGLGACHAEKWRVKRFDLTTQLGWLNWLDSDHRQPFSATSGDPNAASTRSPTPTAPSTRVYPSVIKAISCASDLPWTSNIAIPKDHRSRVIITTTMKLVGGVLVRSPGTRADDPDVTHLQSGDKPILPGTGLAGVLRTRASRISRVVRSDHNDAEQWIEALFGPRLMGTVDPNFLSHESRLKISERSFTDSRRLRPNRIRIDRFTSGVVDGALFDEEPIYNGQIEVSIELRNPRCGELGLILLVLKDLVTGDLTVGGTSSVGRGVLRGKAVVTIDGVAYMLDANSAADDHTVRLLNEKVEEFRRAESLARAASED